MVVKQTKLISEFAKAFGLKPEGPETLCRLWDFAEALGIQIDEDIDRANPGKMPTHPKTDVVKLVPTPMEIASNVEHEFRRNRPLGHSKAMRSLFDAAMFTLGAVWSNSDKPCTMVSNDHVLAQVFVDKVLLKVSILSPLDLQSESATSNPFLRAIDNSWAQIFSQHFNEIQGWPGTLHLSRFTLRKFRELVKESLK